MKRSARPATPPHPLGQGRAMYYWSLMVALLLFSVGGLFSAYEGLHRVLNLEPIKDPWVAVGVLVVREVKSMIIGESADPLVHTEIQRFIAARPEVAEIYNLTTLQWSHHKTQ